MKRFKRTDACTPDRFKAWISSTVKGWTNSPSLINSFVASVSSAQCIQEGSSRRGTASCTNFVQGSGCNIFQPFVLDFICHAVWLAN